MASSDDDEMGYDLALLEPGQVLPGPAPATTEARIDNIAARAAHFQQRFPHHEMKDYPHPYEDEIGSE